MTSFYEGTGATPTVTVHSLEDHTDVDVELAVDGDILQYNEEDGIWYSSAVSTLSGTVDDSLIVTNDVDVGGTLSTGPDPDTIRPFKLGFTAWPYDFFPASVTAEGWTYDAINTHGDIVAHHLKDGIPWDEAYADDDVYPSPVETHLAGRVAGTDPSKDVFLTIDSLDQGRSKLIGDFGSAQDPRAAPWDVRDFDDPEVITAFTNYSLNVIARFSNVTHFCYGAEVSELYAVDFAQPGQWDKYLTFAAAVYANIKAVYPGLKVMCSMVLKTPDTAEAKAWTDQFARIANYTDVAGVSIYPYAFFTPLTDIRPNELPANWLSQVNSIAPGKPIAITETGWIGEDITVVDPPLVATSTPEIQDQYLQILMEQTFLLNSEFVIWWCIADFDDGWTSTISLIPGAEAALVWKDIGLYDGTLTPRLALTTWDSWLNRSITSTERGLADVDNLSVTWHTDTGSLTARGNIFTTTLQVNYGIVSRSLFALDSVTGSEVNATTLNVTGETLMRDNLTVFEADVQADNVVGVVAMSTPLLIVTESDPPDSGLALIDNLQTGTLYAGGTSTLVGDVGAGLINATTFNGGEVTVADVDTDSLHSNVSVVAEGGLADTRLWTGVFASDEGNSAIISSTTVADVTPSAAGLIPLVLNCTNLTLNASGEVFEVLPSSPGSSGTKWYDPADGNTVKYVP
jgi:hypothetical protein